MFALFDINHSNIFSDPPPKIMKTKTGINKWDIIKLKSLCTAKENINKTKTKKNNTQNGRKYLQSDLQRINIQNIQTSHVALGQKKQPNRKIGRRPK